MRYGLLLDTQVEFQGSIPHQIQLGSMKKLDINITTEAI